MVETKSEIYKEFPCDLCQSTEAVEVPHVRDYTNGQLIHICKNCGFIYVKKRRSFEKIAEVWSSELFGHAYTSRSPLMLARHHYIAEFIDIYEKIQGKKMIDIGAGEGQFLEIIKNQYGANVFGVEPSEKNCEILNKMGIKNFVGTAEGYIENGKHTGEKADFVTIMWTLENATLPINLLNAAYDLLKDGGHIVVATGSRILVPFAKPLRKYLSANPVDTHPSRFSINTLSSFLAKTGFDVVKVNPYLNDNLTLCVIAKKTSKNKDFKIKGDNYQEVQDFFERWHKDSTYYD